MVLGTLITISSYSWFGIWLGLEINLLSIIPLIRTPLNIFPSEAALKYFITQSLASSIFLIRVILMINLRSEIFRNNLILITNSSLFLKLGAAPFHAWFPEVVEGLNWLNRLIILTWQKIAPMIILIYNLQINFFIIIIIWSSIIGRLQGLNQIRLRKILVYSSINHIAWIIRRILNFKTIWIIYFLVYRIITLNIILIFKDLNIFFIKQFSITINSSKSLKFYFSLNFLSLGGLPPFLGFLPKWLTINNLARIKLMFLRGILIIFTLITLYFYLRLIFSSFTLYIKEIIFKSEKISILIIITNFLSLRGLMVCTLILNFL